MIPIRPCPATAPEAMACLTAYFAELSARFGQTFAPYADADPGALEPPRGLFLIAGAAEPLGCVALRTATEGIGPGLGEVKRLWVAPAARGAGLARRLMAEVEARARAMGLTALRLDTSHHLPEARALYLRDGWTEIAAYNSNPHADHWFEKPL
ncbi:GNAT family N-acetyltransferase [Gemmobacter caeruleus]|uniref:GNAT family N-acetyltransferase n=1 Tax=Gemmobacter caeruleus TaxID=2595004 RepID=UPI001396801B|nr:GNAT family N-acetyltransferase [Gemmobacter caeruleus]